jgi:RimJ/RimL family protein N-acetyltransferase
LDEQVPYPGPVTLTDGRLLLRPPQPADVPAITEACQDELTARFVPVPVPYTEEHARTFVEQRPERWQAEDGEMTWAITDADGSMGGRLLGMVGLHARDASMREIGFWVAPWARGRGVMTDAARLVLRFGFDVLHLERIEWQAVAGNDASRRVAEKLGFRMEGTRRAGLLHRGERLDAWVAGLLPGELA